MSADGKPTDAVCLSSGRAPDAVLWDLDGTLVDSAPLWRATYGDLARRLGVHFSPAAWTSVAGRTIADSVEALRGGSDEEGATTADLSRWLVTRARARLAEGAVVDWLPGAQRALSRVQAAGIPTALVTTTFRPLVDDLLIGLGVGFDAVVCGDEVRRGKPAPDGYRLAARQLGVDVTACLVVEDSPTGVAAAEAAGARVLAVPSATPLLPAPGRTVRGSLLGLGLGELTRAGTS